jgi:hypothetical protein
LVCEVVQYLRNVVVAVVHKKIVVRVAENVVGFVDGVIPLLSGVVLMLESQIFEGGSKCKFPGVHGPPSHKVKDHTIGFANTGVTYAWETAGEAGEGCPDQAVRVPVVGGVNWHIHLEFLLLHLL